ncbi:hypothetical protein DV515_00010341 [Chloebia gouldiae]|uniref:Uncharacterized protein n=1 Tax=Chloebia gouldiae TaxID=44316 RepID=A0A3L8SA98_CHLGU|nr:hypothetical protein DV515_00010341 [Chloebia gouldiae]
MARMVFAPKVFGAPSGPQAMAESCSFHHEWFMCIFSPKTLLQPRPEEQVVPSQGFGRPNDHHGNIYSFFFQEIVEGTFHTWHGGSSATHLTIPFPLCATCPALPEHTEMINTT